ncbi:hypothetical protein [Pseudodonghicola flavimaris]|uniref:Sulfotransferase family protein n=1 Tax=Pseudodonghicola flavimaris TaxID=3050036 RepID=A0ABT7F3B0_9RHOB|nr:hypothetical protein [Pseudodonghicola flavimaris]MDK3019098.1 hypothetical protein [Pseudodonghicola flavimaris]
MGMLKSAVREGLKAALPASSPPLLVASMGRSGSTVVYDSLVAGMAAARFGERGSRLTGLVRDTAWHLGGARFHSGRVYKTHDFPYDLSPGASPRVVFLFGSTSAAARSVLRCETTYGPDWIAEHLEHLSAHGALRDVPVRDVLRFGEQLDGWLACETVPVLSLRYEDLWRSGAGTVLSRYAGFPVRLPPQRARESASVDLGAVGRQLMDTYAALDGRVAALPAIRANRKAQLLLDTAG